MPGATSSFLLPGDRFATGAQPPCLLPAVQAAGAETHAEALAVREALAKHVLTGAAGFWRVEGG